MKYVLLSATFILMMFIPKLHAQTSTKEQPYSFQSNIATQLKATGDVKIMKPLDKPLIEKEDVQDEQDGIPPRFGYPIKVTYDLTNSGIWTILDNGDKLWRMTIYCANALSINLLYDKFWIPEGGKFFVYSEDKQQSIGAFTHINNKGSKSDMQGFATGLIYRDKIVLEYYQPAKIEQEAVISIAYVIHGYRYIKLPNDTNLKSFGDSGDCQVNINCAEGDNWQSEKNAVALILVNGNRYCTGSLINTTANDNTPLFLTADHCLGGWAQSIKYDAINSPNLNHWSFYWNYESPSCNNTNDPPFESTVGAKILANNSVSDFALLRLTEDPKDKTNVSLYYLGWDRSGNSGTGGVGIHHPNGDVKKIATLNGNTTSNGNYWQHYWNQTINGYSVTEGGSSGSPFINNSHHVIGQLYGGSTINCANPSEDYALYGKFNISWTGNGTSDSRRRLKDWLDPLNTNRQTLDGVGLSLSISGPSLICDQATYTVNNLPTGVTVQWSAGNSTLSLFSGQGTGTAIFEAKGNGKSSVKATIFIGNVVQSLISLDVWVGKPNIMYIDGHDFLPYPGSEYYRVAAFGYEDISFTWNVTPHCNITSFGTSAVIDFDDNGVYMISVTGTSICGNDIKYYQVTVGSENEHQLFSLYPNPATSAVTVELREPAKAETNKTGGESVISKQGAYEVQLWDASQMLGTYHTSDEKFQLPITGLPAGIYFVRVVKDGETHTRKLIKK